MSRALIDANVLLDIVTRDSTWYAWSSRMLEEIAEHSELVINPIIYAEVSIHFTRIEDLDAALTAFERAPLPFAAGFLAGKCFMAYKKRGGSRRSPMPDFYVGAHAAIERMVLVTRDAARYRTYFPTVSLVAP